MLPFLPVVRFRSFLRPAIAVRLETVMHPARESDVNQVYRIREIRPEIGALGHIRAEFFEIQVKFSAFRHGGRRLKSIAAGANHADFEGSLPDPAICKTSLWLRSSRPRSPSRNAQCKSRRNVARSAP